MWTLSAFADEISPDLHEQLDTLEREGLRHLELRGVWGRNVLDLTHGELDAIRAALDERSFGISSIGSPIGKIPITEAFGPHLERFHRALEIAARMHAPYIRVFSFFIPAGEEPARYRDEVLCRMQALVDAAVRRGVTLLHENEKGIYGDTPARCHDLLSSVDSPLLRAAWDPANFVQVGVSPYSEGYELLRPFIEYVHVKDAVARIGRVVPAGEGAGELRETISALKSSGFDGYFSLEPHLASAGPFSGFTGPALFGVAVEAFTSLLREQDVEWR